MADIGNLVVNLEANIAKFESGMKQAEAMVATTMQTVESVTGTAVKYAERAVIGFAGAWSIDKFVSGIEGAQKSAAAMYNLSIKTSATVESLSMMAGAAKASGTDMDYVAKAMAKLSKSEFDAANGNERAASIFKQLGVSVKETDGRLRESGDVMRDLSGKLFDLSDGTTRVAVAQELFGKSGADLLPMLQRLAATKEYEIKLTTQQAYDAEKLIESQFKLEARNNALIKIIANGVTPAWLDLNNAMLKSDSLMGSINKTAKEMQEQGTIEEWADNAALSVARLTDITSHLGSELKAFGNSAAFAFTVAAKGYERVNNLIYDSSLGKMARGLFDGSSGGEKTKPVTSESSIYDFLTKDDPWMKKNLDQYLADQNSLKFSGNTYEQAFLAERAERLKGNRAAPDNWKSGGTTVSLPKDGAATSSAKTSRESRTQWQSFLDSLEDKTTKLGQGEYASMIEQANRLRDWNNKQADLPFANLDDAIKQIEKYRDLKLSTFNSTYAEGLDKETDAMDRQYQMLGMTTLERDNYTIAIKNAQKAQEDLKRLEKEGWLPTVEQAKADSAMAEKRAKEIEYITKMTEDATAAQIAAVKSRYDYERSAAYGASQALKSYADSAMNQAANMQNFFSNSIKNTEDFLVNLRKNSKLTFNDIKSSFTSLADSIISDWMRMQVRQNFTGPLATFMRGFFGGGTSVIPDGFEYSGPTSALEILSSPPPGRASGGPVTSGQPYIVGERGPEWFVPDSNGSIIPNGAKMMQSLAVSNKVEVHIHNAQGATPRVQQSTGAGGMPRIDVFLEQIENGIARNMMRGGGIAPALEGRYGLSSAAGLV
ncbi:MAG: hypothetical protein HQL86_03070 [Magnetococcales bacterium]|nr:hypothetical protein [Magnetococcales bacterium]